MHSYSIFITTEIQAAFDIWIAGDGEGLVGKLYPVMQGMQGTRDRKGIYLYENYDQQIFSDPKSLSKDFESHHAAHQYKGEATQTYLNDAG